MTPIRVFSTYCGMTAPPGEPATMYRSPGVVASPLSAPLNTIVGAIEDRGRFPPSTLLATGLLASSSGSSEKSVSWLLSMNPPTMWKEPNAASTLVVIDAALPSPSTTLMWLVPFSG